MNRLPIIADLWSGTLRSDDAFAMTFSSLDHCRTYAKAFEYDGISVRFGITKWQTANLIRRLRREDERMIKVGLSRVDLAKYRKNEHSKKKPSQERK